MKNEFNVLIKGFKNKEEAEEFISWYKSRGEGDIWEWLEDKINEGINVRSSLDVDCRKTYNHNNVISKLTPEGDIVFEGNTAIMWIDDCEEE